MEPIYRGSVKDLLGPVIAAGQKAVVFEYTDAFSVFDWGKLPDLLPRKGEALAVLAADLFDRIEKPETWREFSRTPEALALRKGNRFGAVFNELGETLQREGMRTHFLGALAREAQDAHPSASLDELKPLPPSGLKAPFRHLAVRQVNVVKPVPSVVLGRSLPDYLPTRAAALPRLVPLEVVFRFSCPSGSSLLERVARDPSYLTSIGFPGLEVREGQAWDFPVLELFTKLETTDRPVSLSEALAISGVPGDALQSLLLKTAWIAGWMRSVCRKAGLELADGKLEWGINERGEVILVDAIGPDELRILKGSVQLSKEFLREFYRLSPWYESLQRAKRTAQEQGSADWKRLVKEAPPALPPELKNRASQLYMALTNELTGRRWFESAPPLEKIIAEIR